MADTLRDLKDKAAALTLKGKWPAALEAWRAVATQTPDEVAAHQKIAELLVKLGQKGEAVQAYEGVALRYAEKGLFFKASAVARLIKSLEPGHHRTEERIAALYARSTQAPSRPPLPKAAEHDFDLDISVTAPETASGLPAIPLFTSLTQEELKGVLASAVEVRALSAGEVVVQEGAPGDSMFALVEGEAGVYRGWGTDQQRRVAPVAAGDVFGEAALVSGGPRLATVVADRDGMVLEFPRRAMAEVVTRHEGVNRAVLDFYLRRLLDNMLRASPILRALPSATQHDLLTTFHACTFDDGHTILAEGQPADGVHVLLRGACAVVHHSGERYPDLREGDLFGELAVLTEGIATATVTAQGKVLTLRFPPDAFKRLVLSDPTASLAVKKLAQTRLLRTRLFDQLADEAVDLRV